MAQHEIDLRKIDISDETKEKIKALADKYNSSYKEIIKRGFDENSFEFIYYAFGVINLTLMVTDHL